MQKIVQEFDADISAFEKKVEKMISSINEISKKAKKVNIEIVGAGKLEKDLSGINKSLDGIKKVKFDTLERRVESLTGKLKPLNVELKQTAKHFKDISNHSKNSSENFKSFISEVGHLNERINRLNKNFDELNKNQNTNTNAAEHWNNKLNVGNGFIGSMTNSIQRLLPFLSALFVVNAVVSFAQALFDVNRQFELFELKAKSALYGSKLAVDEYYAALQRIDIKSLFDINELEEGLIKLLNRRILLTEEQLQSLANTAEAVGTKGAQSFNQIVDALLDATVGQFKRLEELGVGVDATGKKLKLTFAGTTTEVDKGTEAIKQYILGLDKMNGAADLSARTADTLEGKLSSLRTKFDNLIRKMGEMGITSAFGTILDEGSNLLDLIEKIRKKWSEMEGTIFKGNDLKYGLRGAVAGAAAGSLIGGVGAVPGALIGAATGFAYSDATSLKKDPLMIETKIKGKEYEQIVKKISAVNNELFQSAKTVNFATGKAFFNPSNLSTESLKNYTSSLEDYLKVAKQLGVGESEGFAGKEYKRTIEFLGSIKNELQARTSANPEVDEKKRKKELQRAAAFEEQKKDLEKRVAKDVLEATNALEEMRNKITLEGMKERLRFFKEGSNEYLKEKERIALLEIEIDRKNAKDEMLQQMIKQSKFTYVNSAGKIDEGTKDITGYELDEAFKENNKIFDMRRFLYSKQTNDAIIENNENLKNTQKSLFEKISEFIESSQDREKRAIVAKYNAIQNEIDKLRKTGLTPLNESIVSGVEVQIKALEKLELQLVSLRNAQEGSVERSRSSVVRNPNESKSSFNRRVEIAGLQQIVENASEEMNFIDFAASIDTDFANSPNFLLLKKNAKKAFDQASAELQESINKQNITLSFKDGLISKIFGLDSTNENFNLQLNAIKDAFSMAIDVYSEYINSVISLEKKKEDEADKNIQKLQDRLSREDELRRNGLANNYNAIQDDIKKQEELKEKSIKRQNQLQKLQIASNAALQISNMVTAISEVVKSGSAFGPAAPVVIALNVAGILGVAASAIAQSKALTAEKGGILDGARHYNGGINVNAEGGEGFITRPSSIPNKRLVLNLNNIKKKVTSDNLHELLNGTGISMPSENSDWRNQVSTYNLLHMKHFSDNSRLENRLEKLENVMQIVSKNTSRIPEKQYVPLKEGKVMVIDGENVKILNA